MEATVRIIPPAAKDSAVMRASGTKVMVGDTEVPRVFKIEMSAEAGGVWTAAIHCYVQALPMEGLQGTVVHHYKAPIIWRLKEWFRNLTGRHWDERT